MSVVEIVTKTGKVLGRIDDLNQTVEVTEEWEKITEPKRRRKKPVNRKDTDEQE